MTGNIVVKGVNVYKRYANNSLVPSTSRRDFITNNGNTKSLYYVTVDRNLLPSTISQLALEQSRSSTGWVIECYVKYPTVYGFYYMQSASLAFNIPWDNCISGTTLYIPCYFSGNTSGLSTQIAVCGYN